MAEREAGDRIGKIASVEVMTPGAPKVIVHGDVDFRHAPEITEAVRRILEDGNKRVDIQLADVEFMDSSGISALLDAADLARRRQARLVLVSPTRQLLHLLEVSGFKLLFDYEQLPALVEPVPPPAGAPAYWQVSEFRVPCHPELVADIRHRIAEVGRSMPFITEEIEDIKLAVGEAAANAFRYGCPAGAADSIHVRCVGDDRALTVEISDPGPGFDPECVAVPKPGSLVTGGRGIFFMRLMMDRVDFVRLDPGMLVRLVKRVRKRGPQTDAGLSI